MARTKTVADPEASASRPRRQATRRPPVEHSDSDEANSSPSLSSVPSVSEHLDEEEDADMEFAPEPRVNLRSIRNDDFKQLRMQSPYEQPRSAEDERFHSLFQEDCYNQVVLHKQFAIQKYINWSYLNEQTRYATLYTRFRNAGLDGIVSIKCNFNEEVIRQFYATVYIPSSLATVTWMTGSRRYTATKRHFEEALNLLAREYVKIHLEPALQTPEQLQFYEPTIARVVPGKVAGLRPLPSVINRIIRATILPRSGNNDAIRGHAWNVIDYVMQGKKFDIMHLILTELQSCHTDLGKRMYYAPYIMMLILRTTNFQGTTPFPHKQYKPEGDHQRDLRNRPLHPVADAPASPQPAPQQQGGLDPVLLEVLHTGINTIVSRFDAVDRRLEVLDHRLDTLESTTQALDSRQAAVEQSNSLVLQRLDQVVGLVSGIQSDMAEMTTRVSSIEQTVTYSWRRRIDPPTAPTTSTAAPPPPPPTS